MRSPLTRYEIENPERVLYRLLQDYVNGKLDNNRVLFRASVVSIDHVGSQFEVDPPNPKNSIKARIITDGIDANTPEADLPVFWPMFPHNVEPVKELEHVYVIFEDPKRTHGLWLGRIPEPLNVDSTNYTAGSKKYVEESRNQLTTLAAEKAVAGMTSNPAPVLISPEFQVEDVPPFTPRVGDKVLHGSNNAAIIIGRDRPQPNKILGERLKAGTVTIVAGRKTDEEVNLLTDSSTIYVSEGTNIDVNLGMAGIRGDGETTLPTPAASVALVTDNVRVLARKSLKISVVDGDMTWAANNINIGNEAPEQAVLGNKLESVLSELIDAIQNITVNTSVGPSVTLINKQQFDDVKLKLKSILSENVKVK